MCLRTLLLLSVFAMLLFAGCTAPFTPSGPTPQTPACHNVTSVEPVTTEQCGNVSTTQQVCGARKLPYNVTRLPKNDICVIDDTCVGKPLSQCRTCTTAMTRCTLVIKNLDPQEAGTWVVAANYTLGNAGFNKGSITATIKPNESYSFDYQQMYSPGYPVNSADCNVSVISEATVQDCHDVTRSGTECRNVTTDTTVQTQVCG